MRLYTKKLESLNIANPTLRDCFDPYCSEYSDTLIEQKIAILRKVIDNGFSLDQILKDYSQYYQSLNKLHVVKDIHLGLKRLINFFLKNHTTFKLEDFDAYQNDDLIYVLKEFLKNPEEYNFKIKNIFYKYLVNKRKSHQFKTTEILNPSSPDLNLDFDDHLNAWAYWCGNLDADIMLIGQDFGDKNYYQSNRGKDEIANATNLNLITLFKQIGIKLNDTNNSNEHLSLYFTNAVLGVKIDGGMSGKIKKDWYGDTALKFTKPLIDIINPKIIIAMGSIALDVVSIIYKLNKATITEAVKHNPTVLPDSKKLFVVYHCSKRGQLNRKFEDQEHDWKKMVEHVG